MVEGRSRDQAALAALQPERLGGFDLASVGRLDAARKTLAMKAE